MVSGFPSEYYYYYYYYYYYCCYWDDLTVYGEVKSLDAGSSSAFVLPMVILTI